MTVPQGIGGAIGAVLFGALAALAAAADITPQPAPPPPAASELPSQSLDGLILRYAAYYRALSQEDIPSLWLFYGPGMREKFDPVAFARVFADMRVVVEGHEVWLKPFGRGGRPKVATVLTTLRLVGATTLWFCHITEWWWERAFSHEPANWYVVFEVASREFLPCGDQFRMPRT